MKVDVERSVPVSDTPRVRMLEGLFDCTMQERSVMRWEGDLPVEDQPWDVAALIGPSGSGKSTLLHELFGEPIELEWGAASVLDDFSPDLEMTDIVDALSAVGFATVPAWMRPYRVLSNGEQFRAELARRLLEAPEPIIIDEFTSVVDRQVAKIGAYAVAKHIRRTGKKLVVASCHHDIVDWLEPDVVIDPATMQLKWRRLRGRPQLDVAVARVRYAAWQLFAPYHYLTNTLNPSAQCFVLFVEGRPASFMGVIHHPHATTKNLKRSSRAVTLPDWQGIGLARKLHSVVGSAYRARGWRLRAQPANPAWIRSYDRADDWAMVHRPGRFGPKPGRGATRRYPHRKSTSVWMQGSRPSASFEYCGPANEEAAALLLDGKLS